MPVENVHEVPVAASSAAVGELIDSLASAEDRLWPGYRWPPMRFDGGLHVGASGGHGPIRYRIVEYEPLRRIRFRFSAPRGLEGDHWFEVVPAGDHVLLRHGLVARVTGAMRWQWPLLWRPLHDALIEDALDRAAAPGGEPRSLPLYLRALRRLARRSRGSAAAPGGEDRG